MPNMFKRNNKHTKLFGANFYILKVDNRKTEKIVKYVQSPQ